MNSQNFYQSLLSDTTDEINHYNPSIIYKNENRDLDITIMEFKEPSLATFSFLEESNSKNIIYKIKNLIPSIRKNKKKEKHKQERKEQIRKKEQYNFININRYLKPSYKKYEYMDYPFYKQES